MNFHEEARKLEMVREDRKWYENEAATEDALKRAYAAGVQAQWEISRMVEGAEAAEAKVRAQGHQSRLAVVLDNNDGSAPERVYRGDMPKPPRDFYRGQAYEEG